MRTLSPIEAALAVAIAASVLATALPAFVRNLHASRLVEPVDGLNRIATRATVLAVGRPPSAAYPPSAPLTPAEVPKGQRVTDPPGTWSHPTWQELGFFIDVPHSFSFLFESEGGESGSRFTARAHGDLDGDGLWSTFEISGQSEPGKPPVVQPMEIDREVE
ncbi:MAG: hypothetical protein KF718_22715 [Polyangiaceae bacterium]|nr:hypothetical protein [Polyangiaceae bacterium]